MKNRVSLDVESVLANIMDPFFKDYNREYGTEYDRDDMEDWDWIPRELDIGEFLDMTEEQWKESALDNISPEEPSLGQKVKLISNKCPVDIVTSRKDCDKAIQDWLNHHNITSYDKFISGKGGKASLGYKYYIDDNPELADQLRDDQVLFLVRSSWNEHVDTSENIVHVNSVGEAARQITEN